MAGTLGFSISTARCKRYRAAGALASEKEIERGAQAMGVSGHLSVAARTAGCQANQSLAGSLCAMTKLTARVGFPEPNSPEERSNCPRLKTTFIEVSCAATRSGKTARTAAQIAIVNFFTQIARMAEISFSRAESLEPRSSLASRQVPLIPERITGQPSLIRNPIREE